MTAYDRDRHEQRGLRDRCALPRRQTKRAGHADKLNHDERGNLGIAIDADLGDRRSTTSG
jgi:hypothetical protein